MNLNAIHDTRYNYKYTADDIEYCLMLVKSSLRLPGGLSDNGIIEDDLKDFSISLFHFIDPIMYEIKEDVFKYRGINDKGGKKK